MVYARNDRFAWWKVTCIVLNDNPRTFINYLVGLSRG